MSTFAAAEERPGPAEVARASFAAPAARDVEAMVGGWAAGGREHIRGQVDTTAPEGVRVHFGELFAAVPDQELRVLATTVEQERAVVRWELAGTFAGAPFGGVTSTGTRVRLEGIDELTVRDSLIVENHAFADSMSFAPQVGLLPPQGSPADQRILKAFNAKSRLAARLQGSGAEPVADGMWRVRGGVPKRGMNAYLVRDDDGRMLAFDAGIGQMTRAIARADAEGDGGLHYLDLRLLRRHGRPASSRLLPYWDGGPVAIDGTLAEGDEVAGFRHAEPLRGDVAAQPETAAAAT